MYTSITVKPHCLNYFLFKRGPFAKPVRGRRSTNTFAMFLVSEPFFFLSFFFDQLIPLRQVTTHCFQDVRKHIVGVPVLTINPAVDTCNSAMSEQKFVIYSKARSKEPGLREVWACFNKSGLINKEFRAISVAFEF